MSVLEYKRNQVGLIFVYICWFVLVKHHFLLTAFAEFSTNNFWRHFISWCVNQQDYGESKRHAWLWNLPCLFSRHRTRYCWCKCKTVLFYLYLFVLIEYFCNTVHIQSYFWTSQRKWWCQNDWVSFIFYLVQFHIVITFKQSINAETDTDYVEYARQVALTGKVCLD